MDDSLNDDLRIAVMRLARRMRLERAGTDVTDGQLSVLFVLWKEGGQTLGSLREHERVPPPSITPTPSHNVSRSTSASPPPASSPFGRGPPRGTPAPRCRPRL